MNQSTKPIQKMKQRGEEFICKLNFYLFFEKLWLHVFGRIKSYTLFNLNAILYGQNNKKKSCQKKQ